jgi:hypothetical protein
MCTRVVLQERLAVLTTSMLTMVLRGASGGALTQRRELRQCRDAHGEPPVACDARVNGWSTKCRVNVGDAPVRGRSASGPVWPTAGKSRDLSEARTNDKKLHACTVGECAD